MSKATATVSRGTESATVTVEIRPACDRKIVIVDLQRPVQIQLTEFERNFSASGCEVAACSGIRYATRLAGRDKLVAILGMSGVALTLANANEAFAHAAMYAAWKALGFDYSNIEINVIPEWELQR